MPASFFAKGLKGDTGPNGLDGDRVPPIYPVRVGGPYATIQAAINQALADGHTAADTSPAVILIYPKNGGWTEDITLHDGISLYGYAGKNKDYSVLITGQLTYTPTLNVLGSSDVVVKGLYIVAQSGKNAVKLTGSNIGRIWLQHCFFNKYSGTESIILMNGNALSQIVMDTVDGNITAAAAGCTIYDIQSGVLTNTGIMTIGSVYPGKVINCGATGNITLTFLTANCTGTNAVTIAAGGKIVLASTAITNNQANSNGVNISSGGQLTSLNAYWNIPAGTGKCIFGVAGAVWIYAANIFAANKNYSTAIGAGAIALSITPVAA